MAVFQTSIIIRKDGKQIMQVGYTKELPTNTKAKNAFLLGVSTILEREYGLAITSI